MLYSSITTQNKISVFVTLYCMIIFPLTNSAAIINVYSSFIRHVEFIWCLFYLDFL